MRRPRSRRKRDLMARLSRWHLLAALGSVLVPTRARAHDEDEVRVRGSREEPEAASQFDVGTTELQLRPRTGRSGSLVEAVPGLTGPTSRPSSTTSR
jgi:hypothetical protein